MIRLALASFVVLLICVPRVTHAASKPIVAVLYFDNNSGDAELDPISKGFADMVITDMSESEQVIVVEREKLQSLLDESKLSRSRFFDRKTAVKLGKVLGAGYVVSGSFTVAKEQMRIDVRFIEIKTSKVVLSTQVTGRSGDIFDLEQKLVSDFLLKLNLKFSPAPLPPTKVPNLKALLQYSKGLALIDEGEDQAAALALQSAVKMAPAFGLARVRHAAILTKLEAAKSQRNTLLEKSASALFQRAHTYVDSHKLEELAQSEAEAYVAYRVLLGHEIAIALHAASAGRNPSSRAVPRKGRKPVLALMRAYYENQRLLINEFQALQAKFPSPYVKLPADDELVARELHLDTRDSTPGETLLRFVLRGRVSEAGSLASFHIAPALADLDKKIAKGALALADQLAHGKGANGPAYEQYEMVRIHELLAEYLIERGKVEEGIAQYQEILDRFPKLPQWDRYERAIKQQLGLEHDNTVTQLTRYAKGLKQCDAWDMHVGLGTAESQRVSYRGLAAFDEMLKEVVKSCGTSPDLDKMKKSLFISFALQAASYEDCELFDSYLKQWLAVGGSASDAVGYRKNYSSCPEPTP